MKKIFVSKDKKFNKTLSVSQIQTFSRCRRSWYYSYVLGLARKKDRTYLVKGSLVHIGMEAAWLAKYQAKQNLPEEEMIRIGLEAMSKWYEEFKVNKDLIDMNSLDDMQFLNELDQTFVDSLAIFKRSLAFFKPDDWEVLEIDGIPCVEAHFAIPIKVTESSRPIGTMHGFIDLIARQISSNQVWHIDWKVKSSLTPIEDEMYNLQNIVYNVAIQKSGVNVAGSMSFQMLGVPSTLPSINKNGTISRALIRTTWQEYAKFAEDNGQDPELYREEMEPKLATVEWVRTNCEYKSWPVVQKMWNDIVIETYKDIRKEKRYLPSLSPMNCKMCQFGALCQADLRGYDVEYILNDEYTKKGGKNNE